ncbi:hypothetical protein [Rhizobiales bacterium 3FA27D7]|jgi:hypothetical protein|uniref:hypothetical protein n=1 Tax=Mesorhizobium sp. 2RAF21 TaxID=3232995 RepID=UPI0010F4625F
MKVYISKYALSTGITEIEGEISSSYPEYVYASAPYRQHFKLGIDAHHSREDAVFAANTMRSRRIFSLKKQLARLEKLSFAGGEHG